MQAQDKVGASIQRPGKGTAKSKNRGKQNAAVGAKKKEEKRPPKQNIFAKKMEPPFEEYWSTQQVQEGLDKGELIKGSLRINQRRFEEAYIDDPFGGPDYLITGVHARNRALQDDVVVVQVLPRDKWIVDDNADVLDTTDGPHDEASNRGATLSACSSPGLKIDSPSPATTQSSTSPDSAVKPPLPADVQEDDGIHGLEHQLAKGLTLKDNDSEEQNVSTIAGGSESAVTAVTPGATARDGGETLIDRLYSVPCSGRYSSQHVPKISKEEYKQCRTCKVVYIEKEVHSRRCAGHLKAYNKEDGLALLSPRDSKLPRVVVPLADCPQDYIQNLKKYETTLFVGHINEWNSKLPFATGRLVSNLGEAGHIEAESEALLLENGVNFEEFPDSAVECLPQELPWKIPPEEVPKRRDFRKECVFTIDPESARDLDDALHVKEISSDLYEVGVHIADVSYFVEAGTALDKVASERATSVYLVQKVIPMLPRLLSEHLCSLNPNEEKLTFSVVWQINGRGELKSEWLGRSIIRSCVKLSYDHAQMMIEDTWNADVIPTITGFSPDQIAVAVKRLNKLAQVLRRQRQKKGTLRLDQPKLQFVLNQTTGLPYAYKVYPLRESNRLIEEFMLLANMTVARKIYEAFPECAMLRRHPRHKEKPGEFLVARCANLGIPLDLSSSASLQRSLEQFHGFTSDEESTLLEKMVLVSLCSKVMHLAKYFSLGCIPENESPHHYALNVPLYTHFTSPIRRYADIVVHRQLAHALDEGPLFTLMKEQVDDQADQCNKKKKAAKTAGDLSSELFFSVFLKECGPFSGKGMVVQILDKAFDVLVKELGIVKRVYCDKLPVKKYRHERLGTDKPPKLILEWPNNGHKPTEQVLKMFSPVDVTLSSSGTRGLNYEAAIPPPVNGSTAPVDVQ